MTYRYGNKVLERYEARISIDDLDLLFEKWGGPKRICDEEASFRSLLTEQMGVSQELCDELVALPEERLKRGDYDPEFDEPYFYDGYEDQWSGATGESWKNHQPLDDNDAEG